MSDTGHVCNRAGHILTYARVRTNTEPEVTVLETTAKAIETVQRLCKTILRIKAKVIKVSPALVTGAEKTILEVRKGNSVCHLEGPIDTVLFDDLLQSQLDYQFHQKSDPVWIKER
ncbi:MAG: hypothetical protein ACRC3H_04640 [Lachnospiraceae bacterium]